MSQGLGHAPHQGRGKGGVVKGGVSGPYVLINETINGKDLLQNGRVYSARRARSDDANIVFVERIARGGKNQNPSWAILAQKSPGQFSHTEPLGKTVWAKMLAKKCKVEFLIPGRPKSASGPRFSESPSKAIGGTEVLVQIRCLAAHFVAV